MKENESVQKLREAKLCYFEPFKMPLIWFLRTGIRKDPKVSGAPGRHLSHTLVIVPAGFQNSRSLTTQVT